MLQTKDDKETRQLNVLGQKGRNGNSSQNPQKVSGVANILIRVKVPGLVRVL